jgi:hypothetical protein
LFGCEALELERRARAAFIFEDQFNLGRTVFQWELGRLLALEDAADIDAKRYA